jgi:hypothetical protein
MVCPGTLFIGDDGAFLCIPMKKEVKLEHCDRTRTWVSPTSAACAWSCASTARTCEASDVRSRPPTRTAVPQSPPPPPPFHRHAGATVYLSISKRQVWLTKC